MKTKEKNKIVEKTDPAAEPSIETSESSKVVESLEEEQKEEENSAPKKVDTSFRPGYTVKVGYKIIEGGKERIQPYEGMVISIRGEGFSKTFTVRRMGAKGIGVERIFPLFSPKIAYIEIVKKAKARRAKLYYMRQDRSKQDAKLKEIV